MPMGDLVEQLEQGRPMPVVMVPMACRERERVMEVMEVMEVRSRRWWRLPARSLLWRRLPT